jgi:hypothetical protein
MESCITNRLNSLSVLYCNLEKRVNDLLTKKELEEIKEELKSIKEDNNLLIKEELEEIKGELKSIKEDNNLSIKEELEEIKGELKSIKEDNNLSIKEELEIVNGELKIIKNDNNLCELRHQKNIFLKSTPNYLEYTLLYADFDDSGICMYCPSEPYEPADAILSGPVIDNNIYTNLKNILNN